MANAMFIWSVDFTTQNFGNGVAIAIAPTADDAQQVVSSQGRSVGERSFIDTKKVGISSVDTLVSLLIMETYKGYQVITGPKGSKGDTGPQGPKGDTGEVSEQELTTAISNHNTSNIAHSTAFNNKVSKTDIVSATGQATDKVMSQKTATDELNARAKTDGIYETLVAGTAMNLTGRGSVNAEFYERTAGGSADIGSGAAQILKLKGNSIIWNQLQPIKATSITKTLNGITLTDNRDGSYTINGTATADTNFFDLHQTTIDKVVGHKYLCVGNRNQDLSFSFFWYAPGILPINGSKIITIENNQIGMYYYWNIKNGTTVNNITVKPQIFDLTQMFGEGNEPETVEVFKSMFPLDYYTFNAGSIISLNMTGLKTNGFNQWDEETESGTYNYTTGEKQVGTSTIRSKNFIPIVKGQKYYVNICGNNYPDSDTNAPYLLIHQYDANKNFICSWNLGSRTSVTHTIDFSEDLIADGVKYVSKDTAYITLTFGNYGTTYNDDICINFTWSGVRDGEYEEHWEETMALDIAGLTGKANGQSSSVTIFPNGMASIEGVSDEIYTDSDGYARKVIKRIGFIDLGSLTWSSGSTNKFHAAVPGMKLPSSTVERNKGLLCGRYSPSTQYTISTMDDKAYLKLDNGYIYIKDSAYTDAAAFKVDMSGVILAYELATPVEYILDIPVHMTYREEDWGTERLLPVNTSTVVTSKICMDVKYPMNASDTLRNLPRNYASIQPTGTDSTIGNLLTALVNAGVLSSATISAFDATYSFTLQPKQRVFELTGLPTTDITTQAGLNAIGFTVQVLNDMAAGKYTAIHVVDEILEYETAQLPEQYVPFHAFHAGGDGYYGMEFRLALERASVAQFKTIRISSDGTTASVTIETIE